MKAGGSALPLRHAEQGAHPQASPSAPAPGLRSPDGIPAAIRCAASAILAGVSRLAGSFTRARVKFCASPRIRPRATAASSMAAAVPVHGHDGNSIDGLLVVAGLVAVRLVVAQDRAFDGGGRRNRRRRGPASRANGDLLDRFRLQMAESGSARLAQFGGVNFSDFPTPASRTRLAAIPGGWCSSVNSRDFPVISPASKRSPAPKRSSFATFENWHDQGVCFQLVERFEICT